MLQSIYFAQRILLARYVRVGGLTSYSSQRVSAEQQNAEKLIGKVGKKNKTANKGGHAS